MTVLVNSPIKIRSMKFIFTPSFPYAVKIILLTQKKPTIQSGTVIICLFKSNLKKGDFLYHI
jgi:hypothetical protein